MVDPTLTLKDVSDAARELLRGAIDIHAHGSPDPYAKRSLDFRQLVAAAKAAGMGGLVLKSHEYTTAPVAWALRDEFAGIDLYGGLSLDWGMGGLNPEAVRVSMAIGAKVVWMPTFDAAHWQRERPAGRHSPAPGITILDGKGKLLPVCHEILDAIKEHDAVLASGHLSSEETDALLTEARGRGIRSVITHASFWIPTELQQKIAGLGGYVEQVAVSVAYPDREGDWPKVLQQVRDLGPEHVILSSDFGQATNPPVPVGFGWWIDRYLGAGLKPADIGRMVKDNPATLLN